ncbi:MAG TPA: hypothetical protein VGO61_20560 [Steroidobacteraceae bacterium]|jgi:hypothetical protein|nr:hypothetical protein [Steroidobacteraceae bacterium]
MTLTSDMVQLLAAGVAHQVGACTNGGRPVVCRGMAADLEPDGRLVVVISAESGFEVLDAVRENGRIALNVTLPENFRSMSLLGSDAVVSLGGAAFRALVTSRHDAFRAQLNRFGFPPEYSSAWYTAADEQLMAIRFTPTAARNQTPGPGAGNALALQPA